MILPKMIYKVRCTKNFKDGNMPEGYMSFTADKEYKDIPGNVLLRMTRSAPDAFEVIGEKPLEPEVKISPHAAKLLDEFPIPVEDIEPTGKDNTIVKADVEKYLAG